MDGHWMSEKYNTILPTAYGPVIVNRNDLAQTVPLLQTGESLCHGDIQFLCDLARRCGEGVCCVDIGAHFGLYSLALGKAVAPLRGTVAAFEGQRILAYMLAGTMALNSMENVYCHHRVLGRTLGSLPIPQYDYSRPGSFGSVEFQSTSIDVHQERQPDDPRERVDMVTLDHMGFERLDLLKIDAEGMEEDILAGGERSIGTFQPIVWIEWVKSDPARLVEYFRSRGYTIYRHDIDLFCIRPERFPDLQATLDWQRL
jgi:FkbM family methyltransferase